MYFSHLYNYLVGKNCQIENCYNKCIDDFTYCFSHRYSISNEELLKKVPGCKYVENNKYCNNATIENSKYCRNHKCFDSTCVKYRATPGFCTFHSTLKCNVCGVHISS